MSPDVLAAQLTEMLRYTTGLSHEKSKIGVTAILDCLQANNITSGEEIARISHCVQQVKADVRIIICIKVKVWPKVLLGQVIGIFIAI